MKTAVLEKTMRHDHPEHEAMREWLDLEDALAPEAMGLLLAERAGLPEWAAQYFDSERYLQGIRDEAEMLLGAVPRNDTQMENAPKEAGI